MVTLIYTFLLQMNDETWSQAQNLRQPINSSGTEVWPYLSPDNKYLFFVSERTGDGGYNPYWISTINSLTSFFLLRS